MTITRIILGVSIALTLLMTGCASIITGTDQQMTFRSEPPGATITVSGQTLGVTPLTTTVMKGEKQVVRFEKTGYKTYETQLSTTTESWFFGNILGSYLSTTSSAIDYASNGVYEFSPDQYYINLVKDGKVNLQTTSKPKIKAYILHNSAQLAQEITDGQGELVNGLFELLNTETSPENITVIRGLKAQSENDLAFAESLIKFFELN